ncbi:NADH-quinone oxidoreductase subunit NuoN [Sulfurivirga sp.]|uniref:NADH-quinone oxidoreductase subunit NuoN n=1 Tax=Sulfurivirga sp. TaxID=2614236 RepID=UPI0025E63617|nr:NADH-quinone oxidoreductase subunit NuoN [Sulfurivirga sp.]
MTFEIPNLSLALPEIVLLTLTSLLLVADTFWSRTCRDCTYWATQITLVIVGWLVFSDFATQTQVTFDGSFVRDTLSDVLKLFIVVVSIGIFLFSREYLLQNRAYYGEFFVLGLFGVLGMFVMVSAYNLITLYLGLEIMSLALYAMIAMQRHSDRASEAAMKYFVLGALATGMMLYGMSMLYGATGTLELTGIAQKIASGEVDNAVLAFALVFIVIGLAFKLGAVPFHMWVPDVYHGAPTAMTLYLASAPKIAAFAMLYRLLWDGLQQALPDWQGMLVILAALSMVVGSVIAIAQTNLKRMLAYSGIGHVGFVLMGVAAGDAEGFASAMFYIVVYAITSVAAFGLMISLARAGMEFEEIDDYKGLNDRNPWLALMMLFVMFSMAGVPPFIGFFVKVAVIEAAVNAGLVWLAVLAVVMAVVSAFYYLRVVKVMYFDKPVETSRLEPISTQLGLAVSLSASVLLLFGLFPGWIMELCYRSLGLSVVA